MEQKGRERQVMLLIRKMRASDEDEVFAMMRVFYDSPAVQHDSSDAVLRQDIADCVGDMPLLDGYVFEYGCAVAGYAMVSLGYSTEVGGLSPWIEDIYLKEQYRGRGIAEAFFQKLPELYPAARRFKLEVEPENARAIRAYHKYGYEALPYDIFAKEL